ncbi:hypothetical protein AVEN_239767-1 [Araneus ventricosus]|uniref:RNase H type-1 domain-containing protein n=1 Tax=Araneus ventricosus TaxID=182803 RepID=A0A4Y2EW15_ARAVE|nr:hypothetical protein AVEN_239767-1 [Araneus ventricosus]
MSEDREFVAGFDPRCARSNLSSINCSIQLRCGPRHPGQVQYYDAQGRLIQWKYAQNRRCCSILFCWIPEHIGIIGNEKADSASREARRISWPHVPLPDIDRILKSKIRRSWQEIWDPHR